MAIVFHYGSGSPYAWRVWLALEHKGAAYELRQVSFDAGDLKAPEFRLLNPRQRVPAIVDDGFALYESAAIVDYLEERFPGRSLFSPDMRRRAIERRMIRETDQYFAEPMERLVDQLLFTPKERWSDHKIGEARAALAAECEFWERTIGGEFLSGALSAADHALFPMLALVRRIGARKEGFSADALVGPKLAAWMARMQALPIVQRTWPPHWR
jgi:glutathione S-transferase